MRKFWIVKYWLSEGVFFSYGVVEKRKNGKPAEIAVPMPGLGNLVERFSAGQFATSEEEAKEMVAKMQKARLQSLREQAYRVESYEFKVVKRGAGLSAQSQSESPSAP